MVADKMKALVVYDSYFGNTEQVALTIGETLSTQTEVEVQKVTDVKPEQLTGLSYLVVGSPTRAFRPTAAIVNLLKGIPRDGLKGVKVASFDTRIDKEDVNNAILGFMTKIFGYAAKPISNRLVKKGGDLVLPPEGFYVLDTEGPLRDGEIERTKEWTRHILTK